MQETSEILKQVKSIEISTKKLVEGLIAGNYHSIFKGQGIDFSEIRQYNPGDDVRSIDWKVTARFNQPYVKEFIEERDLNVYFLFDVSASGSFGNVISKQRKQTELCASLMFAALHNNDNIGLMLFTDRIEKFIPIRKGRKHILKLIKTLISYEPVSRKTDLNKALVQMSKIVKRRSIIFIVSDFCSDDFIRPVEVLRKRHDVIAIRIFDRREMEMPDVGLIELEDEESGEQLLVDTSDPHLRENYKKIVEKSEKDLEKKLKRVKIDLVKINTEEPYEMPLKRFFKARKYRVVR
jgi:uncharacterized protein (DUF58 family)